MITAEKDGWPKLRLTVFTRDGGCVAVQPRIFGKDAATDFCRNVYGYVIPWDDIFQMEWDHVKEQLGMQLRASNDEAHGITVCPHHHRTSNGWRIDSAEHRQTIRGWLAKHYPEVWDATP